MAHHDVAGHGSADDEYLATPTGSTYEHTDAHTGIIVKFTIWLAVAAVLVHIGLGVMYQLMISQSAQQAAASVRYPLAGQENRLPPVPRLQQFPANEIYDFRRAEEELLRSYGWQNRDAGIVHIPIAEAMRLTVERGLASRAQGATDPATEASGAIPADSSAGRTIERRRQ
jgi:hypothetical protein